MNIYKYFTWISMQKRLDYTLLTSSFWLKAQNVIDLCRISTKMLYRVYKIIYEDEDN